MGFDSPVRAFRAMPKELKRTTATRSRTLAEPLATVLRGAGAAQGSHAGAVARRVRSTTSGGVPAVRASGLPYVMGSEFGGGIRRGTYYTHRGGTRYLIVNRHTTAQFRPYLGRTGYWWTPSLRANGAGRAAVLVGWSKIVDEVVSTI